jgi:hypothetical protein
MVLIIGFLELGLVCICGDENWIQFGDLLLFFLNKYSVIYMNCSYVVLIQFCDFASVCGVIDEDHSGGFMS